MKSKIFRVKYYMKNENTLKNYFDMLIPPNLEEDEYIRLVAFKDKGKSTQIQNIKYVKMYDEVKHFISKYRNNWDLYISISTIKGNDSATADKMYRRQVLFFDFDKKDYPQYNSAEEFTAHVKRKIPELFNHAVVDSGNGYHFYVATQTTTDTKRITRINKELASILGADMQAVLSTQIVRIPTSLNKKQETSKLVNVIKNTYGTNLFKPYKLSRLESFISFEMKNQIIDEKTKLDPKQEHKLFSHYYCIEKMIAEGVRKGERNFALGRITKCLQMQGYTQDKALQVVKEWNARCRPAKNIDEVVADYQRYWNGAYKLLGCNLLDEKKQVILNKFCDRYQCKGILNGEDKGTVDSKVFVMDNHLLEGRVMRKLTGNHYLIICMLHINDKGLSLEQLKKEITSMETGKPCLSYNTLRKVLKELVDSKYISQNENFYELININNYGYGYTEIYYSATVLLINKIITAKEFLVYLCLVKNIKLLNSVAYDALAEELDLDKSNIGKYISSLHKNQILKIEKVYSAKGLLCNRYWIVA